MDDQKYTINITIELNGKFKTVLDAFFKNPIKVPDPKPDTTEVETPAPPADAPKKRRYGPEPLTRWSRKYDCCVSCGKTDHKHAGGGKCVKCYTRQPDAGIFAHDKARKPRKKQKSKSMRIASEMAYCQNAHCRFGRNTEPMKRSEMVEHGDLLYCRELCYINFTSEPPEGGEST